MKVSIVTVAYNSAETIQKAIESVLSQDYSNIEYIIIDGNSTDDTQRIIESYDSQIRWISEPDKGIYDAMNKGIALATGDIIGNLNADDFFADGSVISAIVKTFQTNQCDAVYSNLQYVDAKGNVTRNWVANEYKKQNFLKGWMPPHPTFYLKKEAYEQFGSYVADFKSAGDYEMMLRMLYKNGLNAKYLDKVTVKMTVGGVSNASLKNRIRANKEDRKAWKINGLKPKWYTLWWKPLSKVFQFLK